MRAVWTKVWLLCGTLDALYATGMTALRGGDTAGVWLGVASGPFGEKATHWGASGILAGLLVHFAIMAVMAALGLWLARRTILGSVAPWKAGTLYGIALYAVMYGLVLPARFGVPFPNPDRTKLALGLLPHVLLVGVPMFALFRRKLAPS
ncbi:MAG: hypothetical protein H6916_00815 [Novosphingobium sp.]|uniref:hypothetical protein n=1 Tax=Novosphingobium sp. TaxID=1874826 RepID=UPI001D6B001F|nr:hypothetical protein [Novosphingobium sp.]MCB2056347.1 hypothetical protein [Novosphingobium sp.]MCP5385344.1 hypothetical protein [Novosphingobium sp.]